MEDWQWAIGIVVAAILIAIVLAKRSWVHGKKNKAVKHYTKARDKLSGVDTEEDLPESAKAVIVIIALAVAITAAYFIFRFAKWLFLQIPGVLARFFDSFNSLTTVNNSTNMTATGSINGVFGIDPNVLPLVLIAMVVIVIMIAFGGRSLRRNGFMFFIFTVPILYILGVPLTWIIFAGLILAPIIIWRVLRGNSRYY